MDYAFQFSPTLYKNLMDQSVLIIYRKALGMVNPSQIKQSLNKDCMPTGFIYAGLALTALSLVLQFRLVSVSCLDKSWKSVFETNKSHLIMATLFTKPDKKLKEMNSEEYDKA